MIEKTSKDQNPQLNELNALELENVQKVICPKCNYPNSQEMTECQQCGIIFKNYHVAMKRNQTPPDSQKRFKKEMKFVGKFQKVAGIVFSIIAVVGLVWLYFSFIEQRLQGIRFNKDLHSFCSDKISTPNEKAIKKGEKPFRTGKILVVRPERKFRIMDAIMTNPDKIHPSWYLLSRDLRASGPQEVDTLIRIHIILGRNKRYGKFNLKTLSFNKYRMDVFDWRNKTFIGSWVFAVPKESQFMTEEDYDVMADATSDKSIATFIQAMPLIKSDKPAP